jgi:hypothetical protein
MVSLRPGAESVIVVPEARKIVGHHEAGCCIIGQRSGRTLNATLKPVFAGDVTTRNPPESSQRRRS